MARWRRRWLGRVLHRAGRARSFRLQATRVDGWQEATEGRAPRLSDRHYIGHDIRGRGAWTRRDPLATPRWWSGTRWAALVGWTGLVAGTGYLSWRRHGGKEALFPADDGHPGD